MTTGIEVYERAAYDPFGGTERCRGEVETRTHRVKQCGNRVRVSSGKALCWRHR